VDLKARPEGQDPPDCEAVIDGVVCGIEVTELVHEKALRRSLKAKAARDAGNVPAKSDPQRYQQLLLSKGEVYLDWSRDAFLSALQARVSAKDKPENVKGGPYSRYLLVWSRTSRARPTDG
jgi:hypothetical protein